MKNYLEFGKKLEEERLKKGLTQADFARLISVKQQTISRWENGASRPRKRELEKILNFFHIINADDWIKAAEYNVEPVAGAITYSARLPLANLSFDGFQRFTHHLLDFLYSASRMPHQFGKEGHKQEGIDLEVHFDNGEYHDFQCKKVNQFGPEEIKNVVKKYTRSATKKIIALSCVASPAARNEIVKHAGWDIWDAEDLSLKVHRLSSDDKCRLIDIFFPGQRLALLGIDEIGPWQTTEEFFRPFLLKNKIFNHKWIFVGHKREEELQKILRYVGDEKVSIFFVSAGGGAGKSKLLYELSGKFKTQYPHFTFRIASPSEQINARSIEQLGDNQKFLVVDDAHECGDLQFLFQKAANSSAKIQLLILTRPYRLEELKRNAKRCGLSAEIQCEIKLEALSVEEATKLSKEVIASFNSASIHDAEHIAQLTQDCPLATTIGSYLVATNKINLNAISNNEIFKNEISIAFEDVIAGEIGNTSDSQYLQRLLPLIALLQPIPLNDSLFSELAGNELRVHSDEIVRFLNCFIKAGVLVKRGAMYRIAPDMLSDFVIEDRCINEGISSGYAERIFSQIISVEQLEKLLINVGKLDWRLSLEDKSTGNILDIIWNQLMSTFGNHKIPSGEIIRAAGAFAVYQPEKVLKLADHLIQKKSYLNLVPRLLRNIALRFEYIEKVCVRLLRLGIEDTRSIRKELDHPIQILAELCRVEPYKPIEYCQKAIEFGLKLLVDDSAWRQNFTPFDILKSVFETEFSTTAFQGRTATITTSSIGYSSGVSQLRNEVISATLELLTHGDLRKALSAAKFIDCTFSRPMQVGNEVEKWFNEFKGTLVQIKNIIKKNQLDHLVILEILHAINWHLSVAVPTQPAAREIEQVLPDSIDFRVTRAFVDGIGKLWHSNTEYYQRQRDWEDQLEQLTNELLEQYPLIEDVFNFIELKLSHIGAFKGLIEAHPDALIKKLVEKSISFADKVIEFSILNPGSIIALFADIALLKIIENDKKRGLSIIQQLIVSNEANLLVAAIRGYSWIGWKEIGFSKPEIENIRLLCRMYSNNELLLPGLLDVLEIMANRQQRQALNILLEINFNNSKNIADRVLNLFYRESFPFSSLRDDDLLRLFNNLKLLPQLDGYWIENFLAQASYFKPMMTAEFFMARVEVAVAQNDWSFRPVNYGPYNHLPLRFCETDAAIFIMQKIRDWMIRNDFKDFMFRQHSTRLLVVMFGYSNPLLINFLEDWVEVGAQNDIEMVACILSEMSATVIMSYFNLVSRVLQLADQFGAECLERVGQCLLRPVWTGLRSRTIGSPFPKDVMLRDEAQKILRQLSPLSLAYKFYEKILDGSEKEIESINKLDKSLASQENE